MRTDGPVLVALGGSPHSDDVLRWGVAEAVLRGAPVVLVRAYQELQELPTWGWYPFVEDAGLGREATAYLEDRLAAVVRDRPGVPVQTHLLHGPTVPALRALTASAQLLVVGAGRDVGHGVGRVAAHLAAHARCPVAVVRGTAVDAGGPADRDEPGSASPVVVGVDGSRASLAAAAVAAQVARRTGAPLVVLHARPDVEDGLGELPPVARRDDGDAAARRALAEVVAGLAAVRPDIVSTEVVEGDPVPALVARAARARLLVVGCRGLGTFRGLLLGSVSHAVVRDAPGTVLVVHADEDEQEHEHDDHHDRGDGRAT